MNLLVIDIKDGKIVPRDEGLTEEQLNDPAFDQFADDVLNGMEYTWKRIGDATYDG